MISNSHIYINGKSVSHTLNTKDLLEEYEKACKESSGPVEIRINSTGGLAENNFNCRGEISPVQMPICTRIKAFLRYLENKKNDRPL